jgi:hypothetical protein
VSEGTYQPPSELQVLRARVKLDEQDEAALRAEVERLQAALRRIKRIAATDVAPSTRVGRMARVAARALGKGGRP